MEIKGWRNYQHAAIPITAPHEPVNTAPIEDKSIWKLGGGYYATGKLGFRLGL